MVFGVQRGRTGEPHESGGVDQAGKGKRRLTFTWQVKEGQKTVCLKAKRGRFMTDALEADKGLDIGKQRSLGQGWIKDICRGEGWSFCRGKNRPCEPDNSGAVGAEDLKRTNVVAGIL